MTDEKILDGGLQYVPQIAIQYIYLDFDGELTSYNGEILTVDDVEVKDSALTEERIKNILAELNAKYADESVVFVTERPTVAEYSTIFIGKTSAFDQYGNFAGLAETIDENNTNKTDNAFVNLDSAATDTEIIATISHETDHLTGRLNHGGSGLAAYAVYTSGNNHIYVDDGDSTTGWVYFKTDGNGNPFPSRTMTVGRGGLAYNMMIGAHPWQGVGGQFRDPIKDSALVYSGGSVTNVQLAGGILELRGGAHARNLTLTYGTLSVGADVLYYDQLTVKSDFYLGNVRLQQGARMVLSNGAYVGNASIEGNSIQITINSGCHVDNVTYYKNTYVEIAVAAGGSLNYVYNPWRSLVISAAYGAVVTSQFSPVYYGNYTAGIVSQGNYFDSLQIKSGYSCIIYKNGNIQNTTLNSSGYLYVSSGGTANDTTVNSDGYLSINSGGTANDTTVNSGGYLYVSSGGTANDTTVNGGYLCVSSGGTATIVYNPWQKGSVYSYTGATVTYLRDASVYYGGKNSDVISKCDAVDGLAITSGNSAIIFSGGTATDTTVNSGGYLYVESGGTATDTTVNIYGVLRVFSGGTANSTTVNSKGYLYVSSGGTANDTTLN